jgi:hypothetical protein
MEFITLLVLALLCLCSAHTRTYSLILLGLLFICFPLTCLVGLAIVIYCINKLNQRKLYEPPTLPRRH